jgi:ATP-dependent protease ClpP protease subunit
MRDGGIAGVPFWRFRGEAEEEAELLVYGTIGDWDGWDDTVPKRFAEDLGRVTARRLNVRINSPGGDVFAGQAIYSQLKGWRKGEVVARVDGLAASAASVVAMAADRIIMPRNSVMMIHNPWSAACGDARTMRKTAQTLDVVREGLVAAYAGKTGLPGERIREMLDEETWMTAEEALARGFADEIDEAVPVEASLRSGGRILAAGGMEFDLTRFSRRPRLGAEASSGEEGPVARLAARLLGLLSRGGAGEGAGSRKEEDERMTLEELRERHPDVAAAVAAEAAEAERERIRSLEELAAPGQEALLARAKFEEPMDAGSFAQAVLRAQAEERTHRLSALRADAREVAVAPVVAGPSGSEADILEEMRATARRVSEERRKAR